MRPQDGESNESPRPSNTDPGMTNNLPGRRELVPETTEDLPPQYRPGWLGQPARSIRPEGAPRPRGPWIVGISVLLVAAIVLGGLYVSSRVSPRSGIGQILGCGDGSPCQVADAYLTAFTGGKYEDLYALTSNVSRQRFSDPKILTTPFNTYKNAHDYIIMRTDAIINQAEIYSISASPGSVSQPSATAASVPARLVMSSARLGEFTEDITIPLVNEGGKWRVNWSLGLIFPQLDDPANDPNYQRVVHLFPATGARGKILDRDGKVLAQDGPNGRTYPYGADLAAVTGYASVVTQDDLKGDTAHYYEQGDLVGHAGLEAWGEQYLRPTKGGTLKIVAVNADKSLSQVGTTLAARTPTDGADVHSTISLADQQAAMSSLRASHPGSAGGAVAVDPTTGEVLVLASTPSCDPKDFAQGHASAIDACVNSPSHPLLNYALSSAVPIGSVFKIVTLSAALENGVQPTDVFTCHGTFQVPGESGPRQEGIGVTDANGNPFAGHGALTAPTALPPSCDVIFWQLAVMLGNKDPNILPKMARAYGYGAPTNMIGIPSGVENAGLVPDTNYLQQQLNARWSPTDSANLGIGQGFFLATPAQVALATAAVANNGVRMQPRLVSAVMAGTGQTVAAFPQQQIGTVPVSADHLAIIQISMQGATQLGGTAGSVFTGFPIRNAGKTGTAEVKDASGDQESPHSWYTFFAPASPLSGPSVKPQLAGAAVVQHSGQGYLYAAPIARAIFTAQFHLGG